MALQCARRQANMIFAGTNLMKLKMQVGPIQALGVRERLETAMARWKVQNKDGGADDK